MGYSRTAARLAKKAGYKEIIDGALKEIREQSDEKVASKLVELQKQSDERVAAKVEELQKKYKSGASEAFQALEESIKNCHKKVIFAFFFPTIRRVLNEWLLILLLFFFDLFNLKKERRARKRELGSSETNKIPRGPSRRKARTIREDSQAGGRESGLRTV